MSTSRYSIENFDPAPDEELICSICRCVFEDPVECPCRHIFCRPCLTNWLNVKKSCPICRKHIVVLDVKPVVPLINNMISKLTMTCPNHDNGCKTKVKLENYTAHISCCAYEFISCKNSCSCVFLRKDAEKHEKEDCKCRLVMCSRDCELLLPLYKVKGHNCVRELKQKLEESSKREESLNKHIEELTNEVNTLKKRCVDARLDAYLNSFISGGNSDDNSSLDSFVASGTESDDSSSHSTPNIMQNIRSRMSVLGSSLLSMGLLFNNNGRRNEENSNSTRQSRRTWNRPETAADANNNDPTLTTAVTSGLDILQEAEDSSDNTFQYDFESTSSSSSNLSSQDSTEGDEEFPTPAQRRILKRKHSSSIVSGSSDSDQTEPEVHARRRRSTEPNNANSPGRAVGRNSLSRFRRLHSGVMPKRISDRNGASSSSPRSLIPVEVPSSVDTPVSLPQRRNRGLERTRELLELFSVDTDPDWEPSDDSTASESEGVPGVHSIPAADLLDSMLSDESEDSPQSLFESELEDENYEVLIPDRTLDLILRYSQENSDDDEEWLPPAMRSEGKQKKNDK